MPNYTDEDGNTYGAPTTYSEGDPVKASQLNTAGADLELLKNCKAAFLSGQHEDGVATYNESGSGFTFDVVCDDGSSIQLVDADDYGGVTPDEFTTYGSLHRTVLIFFQYETAATNALADDYLPGQSDTHHDYDMNGACSVLMFYAGPGSTGNYDVEFSWDSGNYKLTFWVGDTSGDLYAKFDDVAGGGDEYCALKGMAFMTCRYEKAT